MADHNWLNEAELAGLLSVDRHVLRQERTRLGTGEVDQKNGEVRWLRTAAARVAAGLGLALPAVSVVQPAQDGVETLTVLSQAINRNIVNAQRADGERVCVRVTDNKKYLPRLGNGQPMTLRARQSTAGNWWTLVGREPRWPGIW